MSSRYPRNVAVEVPPDAAFDDHVLVHCPSCNARARVDSRSGFSRVTCPSCGFVKESQPRSAASRPINQLSALAVYNSGNTLFGAPLWLETECCGGRRLWALSEHHLSYLGAFVSSTNRSEGVPEPSRESPACRQTAEVDDRGQAPRRSAAGAYSTADDALASECLYERWGSRQPCS